MAKEKILSLTKKDFRWDYYRGSGKGGQKRNKTSNCCRCTHVPSGAVGKSEEGRSQTQNQKKAFKRCVETEKFTIWLRMQIAKQTGELEAVRRKVDRELENVKVEIRENNKWVKELEFGPNR